MAVGGKAMSNRTPGRQQINLRVIAGHPGSPLSLQTPHSPAPLAQDLESGTPLTPRTPPRAPHTPRTPRTPYTGRSLFSPLTAPAGGEEPPTSASRRPWRPPAAWWLLAAPIALLLILFGGEYLGGWGITNGSARLAISRAAAAPWGRSMFSGAPQSGPVDQQPQSPGSGGGGASAAPLASAGHQQQRPRPGRDSNPAERPGTAASGQQQPGSQAWRVAKADAHGLNKKQRAAAAAAAAAAGMGAAALAPGVQPRTFAEAHEWAGRMTEARVLVMPSQNCQVLRPGLEDACMVTNATEARCKRVFKGGKYMHSYISPFIRIAGYMDKFGIANYTINSVGPNEWRVPGDGSEWDEAIAAADIIILEEHEVPHVLPAYPGKAYIVLQANAAAAMQTCGPEKQCSRDHLMHPQVKRYLQHTSLQPMELNNAQRFRHLPHYQLMKQVHLKGNPNAEWDWQPSPGKAAFTAAMLRKVSTLIPMFWRWRYPMTCRGQSEYVEFMAASLNAPLGRPPAFLPAIKDRPIDITFSGSASTPYWRVSRGERTQNKLYETHRGALLAELEAMKARNPDLRIEVAAHISYGEFVNLLRSTKIFISPLGHGEYSGKDYEATISRTVMVKPLARHLRSYPNIYEVNATCAEVAMDFGNLEEVVKELLADSKRMQKIADGAYNRLVEYSAPRKLAEDVANMIHDIVDEMAPRKQGKRDTSAAQNGAQ